MAQVIWTPQALADLEAIGDFYARDAPGYAQLLVDQIFKSTRRLEIFPHSGRVVPEVGDEAIREIIHRNYRIVYLIENEIGFILTVFHSARDFGGLSDLGLE